MDTKTVYEYGTDGVYVGSVTLDDSDKSPSGAWNIPANCTEIVPTITTGKVNTWDGIEWVQSDEITDVLCYYNNGLSFKIVKSNYTVADGEVLFTTTPTEDQLKETFPDYDHSLLLSAQDQKINPLKAALSETDYEAIKFAEGILTSDQYAPMITARKEWRTLIRDIQSKTTIADVEAVTYTITIPVIE